MRLRTHACRCVIVSGVSGSGKTTVARQLAAQLGWTYAEGDQFHPERNIDLMRSGIPLTDADRASWLAAIGAWIDHHVPEEGAVVTCSALRRGYRDYLAIGRPWLRFCQLTAPVGVLRQRLERRKHHFMPASLLDSQLETFESLAPILAGVAIAATGPPRSVADEVIAALQLTPGPTE